MYQDLKDFVNFGKHCTCLIPHVLVDNFVEISRASGCTKYNTRKMVKRDEKSMSDNTVKWNTRVSD